MINALLTIALVQSLGFAADLRLALRGDGLLYGFDDGDDLNANDSDAEYWLDRLFLLPLLRLRLAQPLFSFFSFTAFLEQPEHRLFKQSGREIWQRFAASTPC